MFPARTAPPPALRAGRRWTALFLAAMLHLGPAAALAQEAGPAEGAPARAPEGAPESAPAPTLMMLPFAVPAAGGIPYSAGFQGMLSREIPREIGRRMAGAIDARVFFFAPRTNVAGRPQFVVVQSLEPPAQAITIGRRGGAAFVLDGMVRVTDTLKFNLRMFDTASGQPLWASVYEAPRDEAGPLLQQAARDLALALPDGFGAAMADAPAPAHEPAWDALTSYLNGEDRRFMQEQGVAPPNPPLVLDAFLEAIQRDPAYDAPRDALAQTAWAEIANARGPLEGPMSALERLVSLRPDALSYSALARAQALAGEPEASLQSWARSVQVDPSYVEGWVEIGKARLAKGEYAEGLDALNAALAVGVAPPELRARVLRDAGGAHLELGQFDEAIAALEASVKENPADPMAYDRLGQAYERKARAGAENPKALADRAYEAYRTSSRLRGLPDTPPEPPPAPTDESP